MPFKFYPLLKIPAAFFIILFVTGHSHARAAETFALEAAIERALKANEAPKQASQRILQAEASLREAYGQLLPSFTLLGVYTRTPRDVVRNVGGTDIVIQSRDTFSGNAVAQVELFNAQAIPLIRSAGREESAETHNRAEVGRQLSFRVAESYLAVLAANELVAAAARRVNYAEKILLDAKARAGAGLAVKTDVSRARVEKAAADLALTQAKNTLVKTILALQYLIVSPLPGPVTEPSAQSVDVAIGEGFLESALDERNDLHALTYSAEAARLRAQAPWLRYVPSLRAQGTYRVTNTAGFSGDANDWNAALTATWLLYDGGVAAAQARRLSAGAEVLSLEVNQLRRSIGVEIENALADISTAQSAVTQANAAVEAAELYRNQISQRYGAGLASGLEQADANLAAFETQAALVRRRLDWWLSKLSLRNALGQTPVNTFQLQEPQ